MENHTKKCRLCICDAEFDKTKITKEIRLLIMELKIELILTKRYSNFICSNCHQNLLHLTTFRNEIVQKQQELTAFLCRIEGNISENCELPQNTHDDSWYDSYELIQNFKSEPKDDPIEAITIKAEIIEDEIEDIRGDEKSPKNLDSLDNEYKDPKLYKPCPYCNKIFKKKSLSKHINRNHTKLKSFICDKCGKSFLEKRHVDTHLQTHIPLKLRQKLYKCNFCSKSYYTRCAFNLHNRREHKKENQKIRKREKIENDWESRDPMKKCRFCDELFKKSSISGHIFRKHKYVFRFICDFCGKAYNERRLIEAHVRTHIPLDLRDKIYKCEFCPKSFHAYDSKKVHERRVHRGFKKSNSSPKTIEKKQDVPCTCEHCGKILRHEASLARHIATYHTNDNPNFLCSDCGKIFNHSLQLHRHFRTVHMDKTLICDFPGCEQKFRDQFELKHHKNFFHLGVKNFVCDVEGCGKAFITNPRLRSHVRKVHENVKKNCPVDGCQYMTGRFGYMKTHMKNKHSNLGSEVLEMYMEFIKKMKLCH